MTPTNPDDHITGGDRALVTVFLLTTAGQGLLSYLHASRGPIVDMENACEPAAIRASRAQGHEDCITLIRDLITPGDGPKQEPDYPDVSSDLRR